MLTILLVVGGFIVVIVGLAFIIKLVVNAIYPEEKVMKLHEGKPESQTVFIKKYPEADISNYSGTFLRVGLIFALLVSILAFTWTTYDKTDYNLADIAEEEDFEIEPPPTQQKPPPPPPPPPPEIKVVEDEEVLEEEPQIEEVDVEEETEIEEPDLMPEEEVEAEPDFFTIVEDMPRFPGCENKSSKKEKEECAQLELRKYLGKIVYPPMAKDNDIEGKVFIRFIIDKDGSVTKAEVARGADKILNDAALKHVRSMPNWIPGKQRGKAVRVQYVVPINFQLR